MAVRARWYITPDRQAIALVANAPNGLKVAVPQGGMARDAPAATRVQLVVARLSLRMLASGRQLPTEGFASFTCAARRVATRSSGNCTGAAGFLLDTAA